MIPHYFVYGVISLHFYNFQVTPYKWHKMNGLYVIDTDFFVSLDDKVNRYTFKFYKGLMTDGRFNPKDI